MTRQLEGKVALITGGTSGIGQATAKLFAQEGAKVAVLARSDTQETARSLGEGHVGIDCDVGKRGQVFAAIDSAAGLLGPIDIVFANAGIAINRRLEDWTEQDVDLLFAVNAKGQFYTAQAAVPKMRDGGVILLTGSIASHMGQASMAIYAASKAVSRPLAETLSADLLDRRIRVLCLTPGPVATPIFKKGGLDDDAAARKLEEVSRSVPIDRPGEADEIAKVALFLAGESSSFMLGTEVVVDGGKTSVRKMPPSSQGVSDR